MRNRATANERTRPDRFPRGSIKRQASAYRGRTLFVSRHPGAAEWAAQEHIAVDEFVEHLDMERIERGNTVIGTLPVQLITRLCELGARYRHLTLDMPADMRGRELSACDLRACNARLEGFTARRTD